MQPGTHGGQRDGALARNFDEIIHERRATRHFTDESVPPEEITAILEAAGQAPSGYNLQPWRFLVVREAKARARLRQAAFEQEKVSEAPVVIIAFAPKEVWKQTADEVFAESVRRGALPAEGVEKRKQGALDFIAKFPPGVWANRHVMIAFTYLMLAAEVRGWDTAPMEGFDPVAVRREFGLPDGSEVVALLAIGRAREPDSIFPGRLGVERIAFDGDLRTPWSS